MTARMLLAVAVATWLWPAAASAKDMRVVVDEQILNTLVTGLGVRSGAGTHLPAIPVEISSRFEDCFVFGVFTCEGRLGVDSVPLASCRKHGGGITTFPMGRPVPYQWFVTEPRYRIAGGKVRFSALVRYFANGRWYKVQRSEVPVRVHYEASTETLGVHVEDFRVDLAYEYEGQAQVARALDVARLLSLTVPVQPQKLYTPSLDLQTSVVVGARIQAGSVSTTISGNQIQVDFDVAFTR